MAIHQTYICDRCKSVTVGKIEGWLTTRDPKYTLIELCPSCVEAYKKFLRGGQ